MDNNIIQEYYAKFGQMPTSDDLNNYMELYYSTNSNAQKSSINSQSTNSKSANQPTSRSNVVAKIINYYISLLLLLLFVCQLSQLCFLA